MNLIKNESKKYSSFLIRSKCVTNYQIQVKLKFTASSLIYLRFVFMFKEKSKDYMLTE